MLHFILLQRLKTLPLRLHIEYTLRNYFSIRRLIETSLKLAEQSIMTTDSVTTPAPRTVWLHADGSRHVVEAVINHRELAPEKVPTVTHRGADGVLRSTLLAKWGKLFTPAPAGNCDNASQIVSTRASVDDLIKRLNIMGAMISLGERISWGSDTAIMTEAALRISTLMHALETASTGLGAIPEGHTTIRMADVPPAPADSTMEWVCCRTYTPCRGECAALAPKAN
jgi:hypothetical protein